MISRHTIRHLRPRLSRGQSYARPVTTPERKEGRVKTDAWQSRKMISSAMLATDQLDSLFLS